MAAPVSLNQFRKAKARADDKARASENVVKHGRTKAERELEKARKAKAGRDHDQHKREP